MASAWKGYGQARWSSVFEVVPVPCTGLSCCSKKWTLRYVRPPPRNTASLSRHSSTNQLENVFPASKSNPSTLPIFLPFSLPFLSLSMFSMSARGKMETSFLCLRILQSLRRVALLDLWFRGTSTRRSRRYLMDLWNVRMEEDFFGIENLVT